MLDELRDLRDHGPHGATSCEVAKEHLKGSLMLSLGVDDEPHVEPGATGDLPRPTAFTLDETLRGVEGVTPGAGARLARRRVRRRTPALAAVGRVDAAQGRRAGGADAVSGSRRRFASCCLAARAATCRRPSGPRAARRGVRPARLRRADTVVARAGERALVPTGVAARAARRASRGRSGRAAAWRCAPG